MNNPLRINNVSKTFNKKGKFPTKALIDISFSLNSAEVIGLIGPNGAGKTTLIRCILGFENYDSGNVEIFGSSPDSIETKRIIGFQSDSQYRSKGFKVKEFLELHSVLAGYPNNIKQIDLLLDIFHISNTAGKKLSDLSKGTRQKVELIQAFIGNPQLVILDEPTAGLDPPSVFELRDFITQQKSNGKTILFSSHHLSEVEKVCDRVLFIQDGKLEGNFNLNELESGFLEEAFKKYEQERKFL